MSGKWEPPHYKRAGAYGYVGVDDEEYEKVSHLIANHKAERRPIDTGDIKEVKILRLEKRRNEDLAYEFYTVALCTSPVWGILVISLIAQCVKLIVNHVVGTNK